jgi:hypothetical protein
MTIAMALTFVSKHIKQITFFKLCFIGFQSCRIIFKNAIETRIKSDLHVPLVKELGDPFF